MTAKKRLGYYIQLEFKQIMLNKNVTQFNLLQVAEAKQKQITESRECLRLKEELKKLTSSHTEEKNAMQNHIDSLTAPQVKLLIYCKINLKNIVVYLVRIQK